ncbi:Crp/Fnr family transcriptional regulator [Devosia naphthalenivorans]|uniref:Crp/Fnr family transcriptional regulator n=1 Tax=Devosia naphthalenivorans TaxID=2082392 RepID=UPI000D36FCD6|nr:Crp/Fnr family transcriptional regulator [Devosia naphthalenivorans]
MLQSEVQNRLLRFLSEDAFQSIAAHLEHVEMPKGFRVVEPDQVIEHYYFMETGIGSIVAISLEGQKVEVGLVGRDGVLPTAAIMECDSTPHTIIVQVGGHGYRIEASVFGQLISDTSELRRLLVRFVQTLAVQTAYTALSNAVHHVEERLARWILMSIDRAEDGDVALTHEFISIMLAVRRPSVTTALHVLEGNRLIYSDRGLITIRDRAGLESFAADAYGVPEREYGRLIGPMK